MARCGCSGGTCSCVVTGSGGITVTGSGTPSNPFVVSGGGVLTVADTSTVDLTLSGAGSPGSPYLLTATALVSLDELTDVDVAAATTGQVIAKQANGTWIGVPAPTAPPGAITVSGGIEGDGSAGAPLSIKLPAGSGLIEDSTGLRLEGGGAWTAYAPTLTGTVSNPSIGNGSIIGRYRTSGKTVDFRIEILVGSTTTRGSGFWGVTLPVAPRSDGTMQAASAHMGAVGTGDFSGVVVFSSQTISRLHFAYTSNDVAVSHGWPVSLGAGSRIIISGTYEID